jgi:gliding motility-associated-like protein
MKKYLPYACMFVLFVTNLTAQFVGQKDIFGTRAFIENKGQFDKAHISDEKIRFALENGDEHIYFTPKGLHYVLVKEHRISEEEIEEREKGEIEYVKPNQVFHVNMSWLNCNPDIKIVESEKRPHYFTYGGPEMNAGCFKKITYLNVYNKIDIEYVIPEDKGSGIKYNVILHPGADPSQIKIAYSGDVNAIEINADGNVVIGTPLEPIIEHKPQSLQDGKLIDTEFTINDKYIGFKFIGSYDPFKEMFIDPWVTNLTTISSNNYGFDVDHDLFGNLFVYGGNGGQIAKYSPTGTLLWTFPGSVASVPWAQSTSNTGNFVVKRTTGQSFTGQGFNSSGTQIIRLDPNGNYDNLASVQNNQWLECWDMAYHCSTGNVYGFGGAVPSNLCSGILNQVTGNITVVNFFNYSSNGHDVVSHTIDNTGEVFILLASVQTPALNNYIARINSVFTASVWGAPSTFNTMNESNNKMYTGTSFLSSNGFNALASNSNYLYYYDGLNVAAYNKNNGTLLGSTTIAGYIAKRQGGIAVDDCDNIYIGGNAGTILSYHFTGSSFVVLPSINLAVTTTTKVVTDIRFEKPNNLLYVSGSGFVGTYNAINSTTCPIQADCNYTNPSSNTVICFGSVATLTMGNVNNLTNPSYSIQPGGTVQATPVFTVSPSVTTTYTLFVTGGNSSSVIVTNTAVASVTVVSTPQASPTLVNGTCLNPVTSSVNLNVSFNPPSAQNYTCAWSPMPSTVTTVNSGTAAGLVPGINNVTITTTNGCSTTVSFSVPPIPLPATFVIVNPSNDYTITCLNPNVVLTTSITNGVPLSFTWFPVCTNTLVGASMNFTQPCTGQVVGTSSTGCQHTETFTIYQDLTTPTIVITPTVQNITCAGGGGCFTLTSNLGPNVTTNWFQIQGTNTVYVGTPQGTINIFCAFNTGTYWGESVYNITGCKATKSVQVTASVGVPQFTVTSPTNFTIGCGSKSVTSMQVTSVITSPVLSVPVKFAFMTPPVTGTPAASAFQNNPNLNNITIPGTYVVYVRDETNSCISSQSISIIQNTIAPNINFIQPLSLLTCRDPSMVLTGISSNTNTNISWTVPAIPSNSVNPTPNATVVINPAIANSGNSITVIGTWTVGAVDNNNFCSATKTVMILQDIRIPTFSISALTNSNITCKNPDVVIVPITSAQTASLLVPTYVWFSPVGGGGIPGSQFNTTSAGSHTAIGTSAINGCTASATYIVGIDRNPPTLEITPAFTLDCNTNPSVVLTPSITGSTTGFTYSWTVPAGALTSALTGSALTTNKIGVYQIVVTNTINGCVSQAFYDVVEGGIQASFNANPDYGFAPLNVTFNNTSSTSTGASSIISTWGYGNGAITQTVYNTSPVSATYTTSGTYYVYLKVQKGSCVDTALRVIIVDLPSKIEIPNVFTPNGDKSNDIFRLRGSSLKELYIIIYDRWGTKVYEVTSETGNFAWDGKNQTGKDCADGVYFYILKGKGEDAQEYDLRGNVSLFR